MNGERRRPPGPRRGTAPLDGRCLRGLGARGGAPPRQPHPPHRRNRHPQWAAGVATERGWGERVIHGVLMSTPAPRAKNDFRGISGRLRRLRLYGKIGGAIFPTSYSVLCFLIPYHKIWRLDEVS